jgi:hypothetical protein
MSSALIFYCEGYKFDTHKQVYKDFRDELDVFSISKKVESCKQGRMCHVQNGRSRVNRV